MTAAALLVLWVAASLAFANGANDVSKGIATLVGSGVTDYRRAIAWVAGRPLEEIDRAILDGVEDGFVRVHAEKKSGRVLGATMVASHAGEMIGEMSLAITAGLSLATVGKTIHPYPTQAEIWKRLGDALSRTRLTPRVRDLFERYLRWRR